MEPGRATRRSRRSGRPAALALLLAAALLAAARGATAVTAVCTNPAIGGGKCTVTGVPGYVGTTFTLEAVASGSGYNGFKPAIEATAWFNDEGLVQQLVAATISQGNWGANENALYGHVGDIGCSVFFAFMSGGVLKVGCKPENSTAYATNTIGTGPNQISPTYPFWFVMPYTGGHTDPHLQTFAGTTEEYCEKDSTCQGRVLALVSEARHQLNVEHNRFPGPEAFPAAGTWMTGFGLRFGDDVTVELRMRTDIQFDLVTAPNTGHSGLRAAHPGAGAAKARLAPLLALLRVNGKDELGRLESGETLELPGAASVHFPSGRHRADPTDGPLVVITTPDMRLTWYLESEDIWHLDFSITLLPNTGISCMHGILGQTLHWSQLPKARRVLEGGEAAYVVTGLLGHDNGARNMFGTERGAACAHAGTAAAGEGGLAGPAPSRRRLLSMSQGGGEAAPGAPAVMTAGSVAALQGY